MLLKAKISGKVSAVFAGTVLQRGKTVAAERFRL